MTTDIQQYCATCGAPLAGSKCSICGGEEAQLALEDGNITENVLLTGVTNPDLEWAFEAWTRGEHPRMISHVLTVAGAQSVRSLTEPQGPVFAAIYRGFALFLSVTKANDQLALEVPVARFPATQYVGAMRLALELSDEPRSPARYGARGDLLMIRYVGRLGAMNPEVLLTAIDRLVARATEEAKLFATSVQARPLTGEDHAAMDFSSLPKPTVLNFAPPPPPKPMLKPPPPPLAPTPAVPIPAVMAKPKPATAPPPRSKPGSGMFDSVAPILGPETPKPPMARTLAAPTVPAMPTAKNLGASAQPELSLDLEPPPAPEPGLSDLLHKAQTLGAMLSFADQPASMALLIRATVYRAIFENEAASPDAVAHLFNETLSLTKEIYITAPGKRRGAMAIPEAQPAFDVMGAIVTAREQVKPSGPAQVTPITTSQDAKQHLARYVSEIDQTPSDLELRHFLALGALAELLVRTKLPPPTQDRLRGIIQHARQEGAQQKNVDLMMTALNRMIA